MESNRFTRLLGCIFLYIVLWCVGYCIIPAIVHLFGGTFKDVAQNGAYTFFVGIIVLNVALAQLFYETFDEEYYFRN